MSSRTSVALNNNKNLNNNTHNEWIEIIEPKTKQRIYANLETGICAKDPPEGALVSKSEDFSDHWWELYDQKTGKYYYYNPEQQKTAWTKPEESSSNGRGTSKKRLLIIPVSKLQTFKRVSSAEPCPDKCDASTQTIASNLVSTGTQTITNSLLENELNNKLRFIDLSNDSRQSTNTVSNSSSYTHSSANSHSNADKSHLNQRQVSDFHGRDKNIYMKNQQTARKGLHRLCSEDSSSSSNSGNRNKSSQYGLLNNQDNLSETGNYVSFIGSNLHAIQKDHPPPIRVQSPYRFNRNDDYMTSSSSFSASSSKKPSNKTLNNDAQKLATNNLSHYLVKEARAMGIALISDDDMDDEDQEPSDDDVAADEDEDTDLRDDLSNQDLNASQEIAEDSSDGWKSFSDQESPNSLPPRSNQLNQRSPIHCETSASSFTYKDVIADEENPASSMSQQLDHRKLVENFKKSRQTSSFGLQDSSGRNYRLDANQAVQKIKTVADNYFHHDKDNQLSDRHLRQLSTLSTLPRPDKKTKDKIALSKQNDTSSNVDADYDVVEENCGYYSDSDQNQFNGDLINPAKTIYSKFQPGSSGLIGDPSSINNRAHNSNFDRNKSTRGSTFSVESFARENLSRHPKKGSLLFNRKVKWSTMISWTKNSIKQPMISSVTSDLINDSICSFKLIQQYMGDRKVTMNKRYRQILAQSGMNEESQSSKTKSSGKNNSVNNSNSSSNTNDKGSAIPERLRDELAYELIVRGCVKSALRDEIYVQLARQLTENPNMDSVMWGMVLISILLSYFSPSSKFSPFLLSFLETHPHQMARDVCLPRLEKRLQQNWLTYCRKPADGKEISIVRLSITKWPQYCGVFGESLEQLMALQACSPYLKTLRLPWILTVLGDKLIGTGGAETEGIFRCAADHDLIAQLRLEIDCVDFRKITGAEQVRSLLSNVLDPHVIAGLLKLFFRQLNEPIFPASLYEICLQNGHDGHMACRIFNEQLPNLNKDVVAYLIQLLQTLAQPDKVTLTKMDNSNLSMVWAPNLLRAPEKQDTSLYDSNSGKSGSKLSISNGFSVDEGCGPAAAAAVAASQSMIFEQTRQEMQFIRSLIINLDTSFIENVT